MPNIKPSDNRYTINTIIASANNQFGYQHYKFKAAVDAATKVTATWEGYAGETWAGIGTATAYIWNATSAAWETIGTGSHSPDSTFTKDFYGPGYIDMDGYVHILAFCTVGVVYTPELVNSIATDFVQA